MRWALIDFETASACDLEKSGAWRYAEDPTTDILCLAYTLGSPFPCIWIPPYLDEQLVSLAQDPDVIFIAHNAGFEKAIWRRIMVEVYGYPDIPNSRWHDTAATCAYRHLPLKLDDVARVLNLDQQKDMEGSKHVRSLSKPSKAGYLDRSPDALQRVYAYCPQDVRTEVDLWKRVGALPVAERNVWLLDQRINERGVRLDLPFIRNAQRVVDGASVPLLAEFRDLTGGLRPTQRDKFMSWCVDEGFSVPNMRKETLAAILGDIDDPTEEGAPDEDYLYTLDMPDTVRRALSIRQLTGSASVKKLARMEACIGVDGRARGLLQYHAAGPGRWAGRLLQPQNFPKGTIRIGKAAPDPELAVDAIMTGDWEYVEALLGPAVEVVVSSLRHAIIAAQGRTLTVGDFAGIEARVVLALAGQYDKCSLLASGADVYIDMATDIFNMPKFDFSNKALVKAFKEEFGKLRDTGKNSVLGCGFQMGAVTFRRRYCPDQTAEFAERVIKAYRTSWAPEVPKLWKGLELAALETVLTGEPHSSHGCEYRIEGEFLTCLIPSGRKLWYFHPQACKKEMPWSTKEKPDIRVAWRYYAKKLGRFVSVDAFGGLLTENVVQALARDLLVAAMFKCEKNGMPIVLTVHDEIVAEPLTRDADAGTLEQIMCDTPPWGRALQIPVASECWTGGRYRK